MINKKTILVTGSSRGIGKEIILELAKYDKYNLIINYNNSYENAEKVLKIIKKNEKNVNSILIKADVSDFYECEKMFKKIFELFKNIDVLINNAGVSLIKIFQDVTTDEWKKIFDINVGSAFNCSKFAAENMIKNKKGNIINISSIWGKIGSSMEVHYSASKSALFGFTKALAKELAPSGISVNCVAPGVIETDMNKNFNNEEIKNIKSNIPLGRLGKPEEVAKLVVFLSEAPTYITGEIIGIDGGY